jgi:hypothetical protein
MKEKKMKSAIFPPAKNSVEFAAPKVIVSPCTGF